MRVPQVSQCFSLLPGSSGDSSCSQSVSRPAPYLGVVLNADSELPGGAVAARK